MENCQNLLERVNGATRIFRYNVHTGLERSHFELHHRKKPGTGFSVSAPIRPKIPIEVGRDGEGEMKNQIVMARNKTLANSYRKD